MADDEAPKRSSKVQPRRVSAVGRQDGKYKVNLTGAKGGPIPEHRPFGEPVKAMQTPAEEPKPAE